MASARASLAARPAGLSSVRARRGCALPRPPPGSRAPARRAATPRSMFMDDNEKEEMRKKMEFTERIVDVDSVAHARSYQLESLEAMLKLPSEGEKGEEPPETDVACAQCGTLVARARNKATVRRKHEHELPAEGGGFFTCVVYEEGEGVTMEGEAVASQQEGLPAARRTRGVCRGCGARLGFKYDRCPVEGTTPFLLLYSTALKPVQ